MKKIAVILLLTAIITGCILTAAKIIPKSLIVKGTDIGAAHIRINNNSIEIEGEHRSERLYQSSVIAKIIDNLNEENNSGKFENIEQIRFTSKGWDVVNLTITLCRSDNRYYIDSICADHDNVCLFIDYFEYMDLSHMREFKVCSVSPAGDEVFRLISENVPDLEILSVSPHVPFLKCESDEIISFLAELKSLRSFEFIDDENMENILNDIPLFEEKISEINEKFPDCEITVRIMNSDAVFSAKENESK